MEKQVTETTKFKLLGEYSHKLNGSLFTDAEIAVKENILWFSPLDYVVLSGQRRRIRHDMAYIQCMEHIYRYWTFINTCELYLYDAGQQIQIGIWNKADFSSHQLCEIIIEQQNFDRICVGVVKGGLSRVPIALTQ